MTDPLALTDHAFSEAVQCPLRLEYHRSSAAETDIVTHPRGRNRFKNVIRRWLRDVFVRSQGLPSLNPPRADGGDVDLDVFPVWIRSLHAGAMADLPIRADGLESRIPLLFRQDGGPWVLAQLQGRRWPDHLTNLEHADPQRRKVERYLWQLAYRRHLLSLAVPDEPFRCELVFPSSAFRSVSDGLFDRWASASAALSDADLAEMRGAFVRVDVTGPVEGMVEEVRSAWKGWQFDPPATWAEWMRRLREYESGSAFRPGRHCATCEYRIRIGDGAGCWERHGAAAVDAINAPWLHVLDLPGHGNDRLLADGILFQEQALAGPADGHVDVTADSPAFTLQWRRERQIRSAKGGMGLARDGWPGGNVPSLLSARDPHASELVHPHLLSRMRDLAYPLHCIDFEAASFPLPIREGQALYEPVLFQYSCHTIRRDGIRHHHWLDTRIEPDPETPLLESLLSIEGIFEGTIVHFAPFEQQHLQRLARGARDAKMRDRIRSLLQPDRRHDRPRFLDLSRLLRDYYHHDAMVGGLGLKDLLHALCLTPSADLLRRIPSSIRGFDHRSAASDEHTFKTVISNGEDAMHAYLAMRSGLMDPAEMDERVQDLMAYCALDTFTMVMALDRWWRLAAEAGETPSPTASTPAS